ncbi:hypothetical protein Taro_055762 [Colocasia esculenta]|uniref:Uncharacterized protein n=1 Tax=Colocasia esculenta TaxID=4460 RepID=A0A843XTV4_COLES|nr:hypothetical protein [Colocasia esculenta]
MTLKNVKFGMHDAQPINGVSTSSEETVRSDSEQEELVTLCGSVPTREGEQRREERVEPRREDQGDQQAPAPQGPVLPSPPPVDYGVFMQGLVQAMQTQAHTQATLQAQLEAQSEPMYGGPRYFVPDLRAVLLRWLGTSS